MNPSNNKEEQSRRRGIFIHLGMLLIHYSGHRPESIEELISIRFHYLQRSLLLVSDRNHFMTK